MVFWPVGHLLVTTYAGTGSKLCPTVSSPSACCLPLYWEPPIKASYNRIVLTHRWGGEGSWPRCSTKSLWRILGGCGFRSERIQPCFQPGFIQLTSKISPYSSMSIWNLILFGGSTQHYSGLQPCAWRISSTHQQKRVSQKRSHPGSWLAPPLVRPLPVSDISHSKTGSVYAT